MSVLRNSLKQMFSQSHDFLLMDGTLHKVTETEDPDGGGGFVSTDVDHACRGAVVSFEAEEHMRLQIPVNVMKIVIMQASVSEEATNTDEVTFEGQRYALAKRRHDTANVRWVFHGTPIY